MRQFVGRLMMPIVRSGYEITLMQVYEGIKISELTNSSSSEKKQHLGYIIQAIDMIKTHDARRFRRIQRRLRYIVNRVCLGSGEYQHLLKTRLVDLTQFDFAENEDHYVVQLACTLIHEATHGEIAARIRTRKKQDFLRIERLCHQEEKRFLVRIKNDASEEEFDGTWWEDYWKMSEWQRITKVLKRT